MRSSVAAAISTIMVQWFLRYVEGVVMSTNWREMRWRSDSNADAKQHGFHVEGAIIELKGTCATCAKDGTTE